MLNFLLEMDIVRRILAFIQFAVAVEREALGK